MLTKKNFVLKQNHVRPIRKQQVLQIYSWCMHIVICYATVTQNKQVLQAQ